MKRRIIKAILMVFILPLLVVYRVAKAIGIIQYIQDIIEERNVSKEKKRSELLNKVRTELQCSNLTEYPASWIGNDCAGYYRAGRIIVSTKIHGANLVNTLFHEDRHYQQEKKGISFKGYIRAEDNYRDYIRQHVEKDARRYAYVQTIRYAKRVMSPTKFAIFATIYKLSSHPWKGVLLKKYRTK